MLLSDYQANMLLSDYQANLLQVIQYFVDAGWAKVALGGFLDRFSPHYI